MGKRRTAFKGSGKAIISKQEESKPKESSVPESQEASALRAVSPDITDLPLKRMKNNAAFESPRKMEKLEKKIETAIEEPGETSSTSTDQIDDCEADDVEVGTSSGRTNPKEASEKVYGFIGCGSMGSKLVRRLLKFKLKVVIWNRTPEKCEELVVAGAQLVPYPGNVIDMADITFSCLSSPKDLLVTYYHPRGALQAISEGKGYVEMTGMDLDTSLDLAESVGNQGGRYLELQMNGTVQEAENGQLILLGANSHSLFSECEMVFRAMSKSSMFFGATGSAIKLNLLLQGTRAVMVCCLAEFLALANEDELCAANFTGLLQSTSSSGHGLEETIDDINQGCVAGQSIKNTFKELTHLLNWSSLLDHPMPLAASASQMLIQAIKQGYGKKDD